jgi:hypothetical protein
MDWHDLVFSIGGIIFALALLPSLFGEHKPSYITSSITSSVLSIFAITYADLGFEYSAIVTFITAGLWLILTYQSLKKEGLWQNL